jgi:putative hydrolases of HD superfamily
MEKPEITGVLEFMKFMHILHGVERAIYLPGRNRKENDVEHSYTVAMLAWHLNTKHSLGLDMERVFKYALAHDVVEAYAGDTYLFDEEGRKSKKEREARAQERIAKEFPEFPELHAAIASYEQREDLESVFVNEVDKVIPVITNYLQGGQSWREMGTDPDKLFDNKRGLINKYPEVREILEQIITELDSRRDEFFK